MHTVEAALLTSVYDTTENQELFLGSFVSEAVTLQFLPQL